MSTLALTSGVWQELKTALNNHDETAGVLLAGVAETDRGVTVLGTAVRWAPDSAYLQRSPDGLVLSPSAYLPALKEAAELKRVPLFVHTHPGGDPIPSSRDHRVDDQLRALFGYRSRSGRYGTVIAAGSADAPRVYASWFDGHQGAPFRRLRVAGDEIRVESLVRESDERLSDDPFDRQIRAFGDDGQKTLKRLRVGVVGVGGTGSAVVEQLLRLGVGELTLIDPDSVTETNVTRIYGSSVRDAETPKVEVSQRHARDIGLGTRMRTCVGVVHDRSTMSLLRDCDVVFGCTDDHRGRSVLSRLAYWFLIPVIDMGFVVSSSAGRINGLFGRVTVASPGSPCLVCRGRVDATRMREEGLGEEERRRLVSEGYAAELAEPDPAVVTYTTMVATYAVNELLARLFGFGDAAPSELLIRPHERVVNRLGGESVPGHYCVEPDALGAGDTDPPLGMLWL